MAHFPATDNIVISKVRDQWRSRRCGSVFRFVTVDVIAGRAVFLQFVAQGPNADFELIGRFGAVAAGGAQGREDGLFLEFVEGHDGCRLNLAGDGWFVSGGNRGGRRFGGRIVT